MTPRTTSIAVALVTLALGLASGMLIAGLLLRPTVPAEGSVEAGFARDMQVHHAQAVEMAVLVRDRSEDAEVRQLALDVLLTQQQQQGQMFGWLASWGLPQASSAPRMAWMDDAHGSPHRSAGTTGTTGTDEAATSGAEEPGTDLMPGMATAEQLTQLRDAEGVLAERTFLELMRRHHEGGLEMAQVAAARADLPVVRRLAQAVLDSQSAELAVLQQMLEERGGAPAGL